MNAMRLAFEDLPILPAEWKLLVHSTKKPQFNVLRKLLCSKKFDYVVTPAMQDSAVG